MTNEHRHYRRVNWQQLPEVKRWCDTLPDFTRLQFAHSIVSAMKHPLQVVYETRRKAWRQEHQVVSVRPSEQS